MNVTLFVGNGFDIGLGLKTRYRDFYDFYKNQPSATNYIKQKKVDIEKNIDLWSDLEAKLRYEALHLQGDDIEDFLVFQDDLTDCLSDYLKDENKRTVLDESHKTLALKKLLEGLGRIEDAVDASFPELQKDGGSALIQNILTFNYTFSLENIVGSGTGGLNILHPHGDLQSTLVIGAYDVPFTLPLDIYEQYDFPEVNKWLVKHNAIKSSEELNRRYALAVEHINKSDVICIFGMSLGDSDRIWWERILAWLVEDEKHKLLIFDHSLSRVKASMSPRRQSFNRGDPIKERFVSFRNYRTSIMEQNVRNQIRLVPDAGIFDISL